LFVVGLHTCTAVARSLCVSWAFLLFMPTYVFNSWNNFVRLCKIPLTQSVHLALIMPRLHGREFQSVPLVGRLNVLKLKPLLHVVGSASVAAHVRCVNKTRTGRGRRRRYKIPRKGDVQCQEIARSVRRSAAIPLK